MRKVLIITYYWPPAGGPGVQRWLKFVKYLPEFGVEPVVYVPQNPTYPIKDESLEKEIPENLWILKKKIFEPYGFAEVFSRKETKTISSGIIKGEKNQSFLQKLMLYIRGNFFIPDARKFWIKPSVRFLEKILADEEIDTIITTGPPHSIHLIGRELKRKRNIKWIADFRDPWTQIGYHKKLKLSRRSQKKHLRLEKSVLTEADEIITTSFITKADFKEKTRTPVRVITNGFDEADLTQIEELDHSFSFAHIGSLLSERNPENLWEVFAELKKENPNFARDFRIKLIGAVSEEVVQCIKSFGLEENLELKVYIKHLEALKMQAQSQVLLLIEIDSNETRGIIPGKLFEYLSSGRPIIAVGPRDWDVERILEETGRGQFFSYRSKDELKEHILELYSLYMKGELRSSSGEIAKYSRRNLSAELADLLKQN